MDLTFLTYAIYLLLSIVLTIWGAKILLKSGTQFFAVIFKEDQKIAASFNQLLVGGIYFIAFGIIILNLQSNVVVLDTQSAIQILSRQIGVILVILGTINIVVLYVFNHFRINGLIKRKQISQNASTRIYPQKQVIHSKHLST